ADAAKVTFLANMSHELRTPLNAIIGFSEVMKDEMLGRLGTPSYRGYASDIHDSGHLLLEMVNDILDFSRIEAGVIEASPQPFDIHAEITRTVHLVRRTAWEKHLRISMNCDWDPANTSCLLTADSRLIRQALLNLVTNAIKFTPEGGWVEVDLRTSEGRLILSVSDSGKGISDEHLHKVTDAFFQVNGVMARREGGVGLGLAIARSFVEANNGRLEISSQVGVGTVVNMIFPSRLVVMKDTTVPEPVA
ncbi:MAG: ATP-binding protein, partial [Rhodospirillales bacterium]